MLLKNHVRKQHLIRGSGSISSKVSPENGEAYLIDDDIQNLLMEVINETIKDVAKEHENINPGTYSFINRYRNEFFDHVMHDHEINDLYNRLVEAETESVKWSFDEEHLAPEHVAQVKELIHKRIRNLFYSFMTEKEELERKQEENNENDNNERSISSSFRGSSKKALQPAVVRKNIFNLF